MMADVPPDIKDFFFNYKMNLLQVSKSEQYKFGNEDVETVFNISRYIYEKNFDAIERNYKEKDINTELAAVIGKITNSNYIIEKATDGREVLNMCTALEELRSEGMREGEEKGIKQNKIETVYSSMREGLSIDVIARITGLTIEEVKKILESKE